LEMGGTTWRRMVWGNGRVRYENEGRVDTPSTQTLCTIIQPSVPCFHIIQKQPHKRQTHTPSTSHPTTPPSYTLPHTPTPPAFKNTTTTFHKPRLVYCRVKNKHPLKFCLQKKLFPFPEISLFHLY